MKRVAVLCGALCYSVLAACGPSGGDDVSGVDTNLNCSAMISAANSLVVGGKVDSDPELAGRALVTSMTYLNAYAIPKGLKEADAFTDVKARRTTLLETLSPDEVMSQAKGCMERSPR